MLRGLPRGGGEQLHLFRPSGEIDLLWCVEEALRATPISLVIAEPDKPLSLAAGRTTGLMLIHEGAGSNPAETRWNCEPVASMAADSTLHRWSVNRTKRELLKSGP